VGKDANDRALTLTFLYCHHRQTPEAEAWLTKMRHDTKEHKQPGLKMGKLPSPMAKMRHYRCLSAYCMPSPDMMTLPRAMAEVKAMKPGHSAPLIFTALLEPKRLPMEDYEKRLVQAARRFGRENGVTRLATNVTRLYFHPADTVHMREHLELIGIPGRLFYRMAVLGEDDEIRLRPVDHHVLLTLLEFWSSDFHRKLSALNAAEREPRCVCPAHLGIFGSGMHFIMEQKDHPWRLLLNMKMTMSTRSSKPSKGWPDPMPAIHPFPGMLDEAFLASFQGELDMKEALYLHVRNAMFKADEALPNGLTAATIRAVDPLEGDKFERALSSLVPRVSPHEEEAEEGEDDEDEEEREALGEAQEEEVAVPTAAGATERIKRIFGLHGRGCNPPSLLLMEALALEIPLGTGGMAEFRGEGNFDLMRCYAYCQAYESWLLHGHPEPAVAEEEAAEEPDL